MLPNTSDAVCVLGDLSGETVLDSPSYWVHQSNSGPDNSPRPRPLPRPRAPRVSDASELPPPLPNSEAIMSNGVVSFRTANPKYTCPIWVLT